MWIASGAHLRQCCSLSLVLALDNMILVLDNLVVRFNTFWSKNIYQHMHELMSLAQYPQIDEGVLDDIIWHIDYDFDKDEEIRKVVNMEIMEGALTQD